MRADGGTAAAVHPADRKWGEWGKKYSRSSRQSVRIFYREIGAVDSGMLEAANTATKLSMP